MGQMAQIKPIRTYRLVCFASDCTVVLALLCSLSEYKTNYVAFDFLGSSLNGRAIADNPLNVRVRTPSSLLVIPDDL